MKYFETTVTLVASTPARRLQVPGERNQSAGTPTRLKRELDRGRGDLPASPFSDILGVRGVIWLTHLVEPVEEVWGIVVSDPQLGDASVILLHHLAANGNELFGRGAPGKETNVRALIERGFFACGAENQDGN